CAPNTRLIASTPLLPPPPEADLRPVSPPELEPADPLNTGDVGDYSRLISNLLAVELASIFGLPDGAEGLVQEAGSAHLVPVLDAVTGEIIIPMLFEALEQREQALISDTMPRISLGDRERLYRLIIDAAMARVWQTASGDATGRAAYLAHLAARSSGQGDDTFLAWRGIDGAVWRQRIHEHLQPANRPFVVLGVLTSHYLHTHIFSITGYLIARSFADGLIDHEAGSAVRARRSRENVETLAAELMNRAKLPLLGVDSLFTIDAAGPCAGSGFFQAADRFLKEEQPGTERRRPSDPVYAERIEASLRDQEHEVARYMSGVLPDEAANPIRFAGFDVAAWKALVQEPAECAKAPDVKIAADAVPRRETLAPKPGDQACETVVRRAHVIPDDRLRASLCVQLERMFPRDARDLLLANLARGRLSAAERSALTVGLALLPDAAP
ncbi:MAG: hypothetical protein ACR2RE_00040, partial [Geminicoccaceae bacterium]